ncbi:hypothetical protein TEU_07505 [Thermococcus eurythermalis]|uniref:Uncharacterized protein n=1 Tax=Thermococcus eurythermalis TaxID=1505907 RepID=A0A097QUN4_9EURY|nr:hypothetical protein [Thermococcus eurythermalis]AIU70189.1 hypothetical protein TEU_07505 [Thermococcus eurythermalis]
MPLLIAWFELSQLKAFRQALEKVEELRLAVPVEVANIEMEGEKVKLVVRVPADSLKLVRSAFPEGVLVA